MFEQGILGAVFKNILFSFRLNWRSFWTARCESMGPERVNWALAGHSGRLRSSRRYFYISSLASVGCACACTLCACARVGNPWRVASACMVERHGVRPGVTSRTRKIQVCPCVNLCTPPTCSCVFVCVVLSPPKKKKCRP